MGGGADGEGAHAPSPVSTVHVATCDPHPARPPASSPALGAGAVVVIPYGKPCPGIPLTITFRRVRNLAGTPPIVLLIENRC
jgi:hypothetical protein